MMRIRFRRWSLVTTLAATAACASADQLDEAGYEFDELAESVTSDTAATYTLAGVQSGKCVQVAGGGTADAAHDHRLAMAFAIAGSRARGAVQITGADAVAVSYPGFFDELDRIARGL